MLLSARHTYNPRYHTPSNEGKTTVSFKNRGFQCLGCMDTFAPELLQRSKRQTNEYIRRSLRRYAGLKFIFVSSGNSPFSTQAGKTGCSRDRVIVLTLCSTSRFESSRMRPKRARRAFRSLPRSRPRPAPLLT